MVEEFKGEYRWLSNFAPVKIILNGIEYPSVEHAYMSAKSDDKNWKLFCSNPFNTAGQVKAESRKINLKTDWENIKLAIMEECINQKFSQEPYKSELLKLGDQYIREGNRWGDKFWGFCLKTNKGENNLGKLIMKVRNKLQLELIDKLYDVIFDTNCAMSHFNAKRSMIESDCINCGKKYDTVITHDNDDIEPKFCSDECGEKYYNKKSNKI